MRLFMPPFIPLQPTIARIPPTSASRRKPMPELTMTLGMGVTAPKGREMLGERGLVRKRAGGEDYRWREKAARSFRRYDRIAHGAARRCAGRNAALGCGEA